MGHVLDRLVQVENRLVQLPHLVSLQQEQEVSTGPCRGQELGFLLRQVVQELQAA